MRIFFTVAAYCFGKSSPRFEQWVLDLPTIGPMVRDHRAGLGMPRRITRIRTIMANDPLQRWERATNMIQAEIDKNTLALNWCALIAVCWVVSMRITPPAGASATAGSHRPTRLSAHPRAIPAGP